MKLSKSACCFAIVFSACTCFAQMYTVTDLGMFNPTGINSTARVVGNLNGHAFLWTSSNGFQDLGILTGGSFSTAAAINDSGTVVGTADGFGTVISPDPSLPNQQCTNLTQPFVWTANNGIQGLGTLGINLLFPFGFSCEYAFYGRDINDSDQVVGDMPVGGDQFAYWFLWTSINGMSFLPAGSSFPPALASGISNTGEIVGQTDTGGGTRLIGHATALNGGIVTDLGPSAPAGEVYGSSANGVNDLGMIVGWSTTNTANCCFNSLISPVHAILWMPSGGLSDLGTLPGDTSSAAVKINSFGQFVGSSGNTEFTSDWCCPFEVIGRPFIGSQSSAIQDLNALIPGNSGWVLTKAADINTGGQIVGLGTLNGESHGFLLNPIYNSFVQQPINPDGSSVFSAKRGVVPVKFSLTQYGLPICTLLPATIGVTRTAGGTLATIDESTYSMQADGGSNFRIDPTACQYVYNLAASALGVGTYRVDISINGIMVGHAVLALK